MDAPSIQVLGSFQLVLADGPVKLGARSAEEVLAKLALAAPEGVPRGKLSAQIWPDSCPTQARANLRQAIQRIRKVSESILQEADERLTLNPAVRCDYWKARRLRRAVLTSGEDDPHRELVTQQFELAQKELLGEWDFEWLQEERKNWLAERLAVFNEMALLLQGSGELDRALQIMDQAAQLAPSHLESAVLRSRLLAKIKGPKVAFEQLHRLKVTLRKESDLPLPLELQRLEREFEQGNQPEIAPPKWVNERQEGRLLIRLFESNLEKGGEQTLELIAAEMYSPLCMRYPEVTLGLLRIVNGAPYPPTSTRAEVLKAQAHYGAIVGDVEAQHSATDRLISEYPADNLYHIKGLSMKGYAFLAERRYADARRYMIKARDLESSEERRWQTGAQLMFLEMYEGNFAESIRICDSSLAAFDQAGSDNAVRNATALCEARAYLALLMKDWSAAIAWANELERRSRRIGSSKLELSEGYAGVARLMLGSRKEGARAIGELLSHTVRNGLLWDFDVFLDCSAVALHQMGRAKLSKLLLGASHRLRKKHQHRRALAEETFLSEILETPKISDPEQRLQNPLALQSEDTLGVWVSEQLLELA